MKFASIALGIIIEIGSMRSSSNFYSFLFAGVLLTLVLLSKTDGDDKNNLSYQDNIKNTSLAASVQPVVFSSFDSNSVPIKIKSTFFSDAQINNAFALKAETEEARPIKKENAPDLVLSARIALAKDLESEKELWSRNTEKHWPIASITKLMTAAIALEKIGPDKIVSISQTAIDIDESKSGNFLAGEKYSIKDLVKIMLFISSNKAAAAISEFYGQKNFIDEMNLKAEKIGLRQTKFYDCTGLSFQNQSTTEDLVKLANYIIKERPEIFEYTKLKEMSAIEIESGSVKFFTNINYFAGCKDFLGGKTGFIESSGQNLLSLFNYNGHKILIIILGSDDKFADTENLFEWIKKSYEF